MLTDLRLKPLNTAGNAEGGCRNRTHFWERREQWEHSYCQQKTGRRNPERQASVPKAATDKTQKMGRRCIPLSFLKGHGACHITYFGDFSIIYLVFYM